MSSSLSSPYLQHVKALSVSWPRLLYLADFMEASTVPAKAKCLPLNERAERWNRVKASILSFHTLHDIERKDYSSLFNLSSLLNTADINSKVNRLIVTEDISSGLIELLGFHFDVDPHFFRGHLADHTCYNIKDPWVELPELDSTVENRSYFNMR